MEYILLCWFLLKWIFLIWIFSFAGRLFFSSDIQEIFTSIDRYIYERIAAIPVILSNCWLFAETILYFLGNLVVLLLLFFGIFMLFYSVHLHFHNVELTAEWWYQLAKQLVEEKTAWSGATMVVGTTVAIAHMWKLNLDKKQYFEKLEKEQRELYEKHREKSIKNFGLNKNKDIF